MIYVPVSGRETKLATQIVGAHLVVPSAAVQDFRKLVLHLLSRNFTGCQNHARVYVSIVGVVAVIVIVGLIMSEK